MNLGRLLSLIRKEFIQIVRDPRTLAITFVMPVMQIFLLGYAATNDVRNVPLAVWDQDRSWASRQLLDAYRAADYFHLDYDVDSEAELRRLIDTGQARAGLIIPPDYAARLAGGETAAGGPGRRWFGPHHCQHRALGGHHDRPDQGHESGC